MPKAGFIAEGDFIFYAPSGALKTKQKNHPTDGFFVWRRRRDSFVSVAAAYATPWLFRRRPLRGATQTVPRTVWLTPFESLINTPKFVPHFRGPRETNKKTIQRMVSLFGGEGEIRTLERCYPLRDFQSRALDQLRDFSTGLHFASFPQRAWLLYHSKTDLSTQNFLLFAFSKEFFGFINEKTHIITPKKSKRE